MFLTPIRCYCKSAIFMLDFFFFWGVNIGVSKTLPVPTQPTGADDTVPTPTPTDSDAGAGRSSDRSSLHRSTPNRADPSLSSPPLSIRRHFTGFDFKLF